MKTSVRIHENGRDLVTEKLFFKSVFDDSPEGMLGRTSDLNMSHRGIKSGKPIRTCLNKNFFDAERSVQEDLQQFPQMSFTQKIRAGVSALLYQKMLENGSSGLHYSFMEVTDEQDPQVLAFRKATDELVVGASTLYPYHMADFKTHIFKNETSPS